MERRTILSQAVLSVSLLSFFWILFAIGLVLPERSGVPSTDYWLGWSDAEIEDGELWRLFTPSVVHTDTELPGPRGLGHMVVNSVGILVCLAWLEVRVSRRAAFVALAVGFCFSFWPLILFGDDVVSMRYFGGSSGLIWAAAGVCLAFSITARRFTPPGLYLGYIVVVNLARLVSDGLDEPIVVHACGLAAGLGAASFGHFGHHRWFMSGVSALSRDAATDERTETKVTFSGDDQRHLKP